MTEKPIIEVQNISKSFKQTKAVLDFSLTLPKGVICGFLGPNGSGKTTSLRMLCGLMIPDTGSGQCLGYDIMTENRLIRTEIGYMPQLFSLYRGLTIQENLDFVARLYRVPNPKQAVADIIEEFNFAHRLNQLTGSLSGSWKQRLALAVIMLHQPRLLLLDEPTAGVDPESRQFFWNKIVNLIAEKKVTALVSTHYMDEAERCNYLLYMAYGRILVFGTLQEVIKKTGLTTWRIYGPELVKLRNHLLQGAGVLQALVHGNSLRVSGSDPDLLAKTITQLAPEQWEFQLVETSLDDCFTYLINNVQDER